MIILSNAQLKMLATYLYIWNLAMLMAYAVTIQGVCEDATFPGKPFFYDGDVVKAAPGTKLTVHCKQEYMENSPTVQCIDGKWTDPVPPCEEVQCELPHFPDHASPTMRCRQFRCSTTYKCDDGYWYNGTETIFCQRDNKWNGEPGICLGVVCPKLPTPVHGQIIQPDLSYGANATITCDEGYIYSNPNQSVRWCVGSGIWSGGNGTCEDVRCPKIPDPKHGKVLQPERSFKATATVVCDVGYNYTRLATRVCLGNNSWSGDKGECTVNHCPDITDVAHGILSAKKGIFTDIVNLQCETGFKLDGPNTISCQSNGEWSADLGNCRTPEKSLQTLLIATLIPSVLVLALGVSFATWYKCHGSKLSYRSVSIHEEGMGLTSVTAYYCTFTLEEEVSKEHFDVESVAGKSFVDIITSGVYDAIKQKIYVRVDAAVTHMSPESRTVYLEIRSKQQLQKSVLVDVFDKAEFKSKIEQSSVYHVQKNSILFRDRLTHILAAEIDLQRHVPDKEGDRRIDIDKQYVRLKLLSHESMGTMQRDELERPDLYQRGLEKHRGRDITDEDLLTNRDNHNYILIRGRAGIGKSTLVQRLLWKWSTGEWATKMKAIFLLNLRVLMTFQTQMDLPSILSRHSVYTSVKAGVTIDPDWLEKNQQFVGFMIDGIDEIRDFSELWEKTLAGNKLLADCATPLEWCFALMRRDILGKSTIMISSRPFADLRLIVENIALLKSSTNLRIVELMGLTRDRVFEFVEKNAREKKEFVKHTLMKNPILLSVCAITFYCAALCDLLVDGDVMVHTLTTYTQITAYILTRYMHRSIVKHDTKKKELSEVINHLKKVASDGLLKPGPCGLPRLVFDEKDLIPESGPELIPCMRQTGLLMDTHYEDPLEKGQTKVQSQFVHLSIQEFMAMMGLVNSEPDRIKSVVDRLSSSQQFNMALLFLYGIVFDKSTTERLPSGKVDQPIKTRQLLFDRLDKLEDELQATQIALESQSPEVAQRIGEKHFEKKMSISRTKLTVIDIMSMIWVLHHCPSTDVLGLKDVGIDLTSVHEIAEFLKKEDTLKSLELDDDNLDDECTEELMVGIKANTSLTTFKIWSNDITSQGVQHIADTLKVNRRLEDLSITSEGINDSGIKLIGEALEKNNTVTKLCLSSSQITDEGVECISQALAKNSTLRQLRLLDFQMGDAGATAVLGLLKDSRDINVWIKKPCCTAVLLRQLTAHEQVKIL